MKVLQLMQDDYLPRIGGNAKVADNFRKLMDGIIENYIFLDNKDRPSFQKLDNGVVVFNSRGDRDMVHQDLHSVSSSLGIDTIIVHDPNHERYNRFVKETSAKKILALHYYDEDDIKSSVDMYDKIIVFQRAHYDAYIKKGLATSKKLYYMPQPMDTSVFHPYDDVPKIPRSIVYMGRIIKEKGIDLIFPYLKELDATYVMIGPAKREMADYIAKESKRHDVLDRVILVDPLYGEALARELCRHSIFILPSSSDCYSLSMSEALCCGLMATALAIPNAFNWAEGMSYIARDMDDMVAYIKKTLDSANKVSYHEKMIKETSIRNLRTPFCDMIYDLHGVNSHYHWRV